MENFKKLLSLEVVFSGPKKFNRQIALMIELTLPSEVFWLQCSKTLIIALIFCCASVASHERPLQSL